MTEAEMNRIDRSIEINAPPDKVWRALTNAADLDPCRGEGTHVLGCWVLDLLLGKE